MKVKKPLLSSWDAKGIPRRSQGTKYSAQISRWVSDIFDQDKRDSGLQPHLHVPYLRDISTVSPCTHFPFSWKSLWLISSHFSGINLNFSSSWKPFFGLSCNRFLHQLRGQHYLEVLYHLTNILPYLILHLIIFLCDGLQKKTSKQGIYFFPFLGHHNEFHPPHNKIEDFHFLLCEGRAIIFHRGAVIKHHNKEK